MISDSSTQHEAQLATDPPPAVGSAAFFRAIVETAANPYVVVDDDLVLLYATPSIEMLLGWKPTDWVGRNVAELLSPDSLQTAVAGIPELDFASRDPHWVGAPVRLFLTAADGTSVPVDAYAREEARTGVSGMLVQLVRAGAAQTLSDAVDTILEGNDLERALELLTSLIEHDITNTAAMLGSGWDGTRFTLVSGRDRLLHLNALDPIDQSAIARVLDGDRGVEDVFDALAPATRAAAERRGWRGCWCAPVPGYDANDPAAALFIWRVESGPPGAIFGADIRRSVGLARLALRWMGQQQVLTWMASHDQLTGLTNRSEFQNQLDASAGEPHAVLFCDLDDFKPVNEELGHRAGDRILSAAAARMRDACTGSVVARVGGDEFSILLRDTCTLDAALHAATRLQQVFTDPIVMDNNQVKIGLTIGVAFDPTGTTGSDRLMDQADRLLRHGKTHGKGQILSTTMEQ